jgi:protein TonB
MELQTLLNADYLDILFDNRNKKYGSYELRRNYQRRTLSALGIVTGISALLIAYGLYVNHCAHSTCYCTQR